MSDFNSHSCPAIIFGCIDWRLHPGLEDIFSKKYHRFDLCATAGSLKGFSEPSIKNFLFKQITISQNLHQSKTIVLTMHRDCGAYGGSQSFAGPEAEFKHHQKELQKIGRLLSQKFPGLKIETFFVELKTKGNVWACSLN